MRTIECIKQYIGSIIDGEFGAEVYFLLKIAKDEYSLRRVDVEADVKRDIENEISKNLRIQLLNDNDIKLSVLSKADDRKDYIYKYDLSEIPKQLQLVNVALTDDNIKPFNFSSDDIGELKAVIILLGRDNLNIALYTHQYPVNIIKKAQAGMFISKKESNRFGRLEEDVVRFGSKFDFFSIENTHYILNIDVLEKFFSFHEAVKNKCRESIDIIDKTALLEDSLALKSRMDDISFARKIIRAVANSKVLNEVNNAQIIEFVLGKPAIRNKLDCNKDTNQLKLTTKKSHLAFLKLINDSYLTSELTKNEYDADNKDQLSSDENISTQ